MTRTGKPRGRPPKPAEEKYVRSLITFPPDLWRDLRERFPAASRERSAFVADAVREKLVREHPEGGDQ